MRLARATGTPLRVMKNGRMVNLNPTPRPSGKDRRGRAKNGRKRRRTRGDAATGNTSHGAPVADHRRQAGRASCGGAGFDAGGEDNA